MGDLLNNVEFDLSTNFYFLTITKGLGNPKKRELDIPTVYNSREGEWVKVVYIGKYDETSRRCPFPHRHIIVVSSYDTADKVEHLIGKYFFSDSDKTRYIDVARNLSGCMRYAKGVTATENNLMTPTKLWKHAVAMDKEDNSEKSTKGTFQRNKLALNKTKELYEYLDTLPDVLSKDELLLKLGEQYGSANASRHLQFALAYRRVRLNRTPRLNTMDANVYFGEYIRPMFDSWTVKTTWASKEEIWQQFVASHICPRAENDGLVGIMLAGKPGTGKSTFVSSLDYHDVPSDSQGVERFNSGDRKVVCLEDWAFDMLLDSTNDTTIRKLATGRSCQVKISGGVAEIPPVWLYMTTNHTYAEFLTLPEPLQQRFHFIETNRVYRHSKKAKQLLVNKDTCIKYLQECFRRSKKIVEQFNDPYYVNLQIKWRNNAPIML